MAKMESVTAQMKEIADDVGRNVKELADKSGKESAKECAQKLRSTSPKGPRGYAQSWTFKKVDGAWVCYNKEHYQLTHLLENSHLIRNKKGTYGRTSPGHGQVIHIKPVADEGVEGFELRINRGLNEV